MTPVPPVRRDVLVNADPGTAFEVFTDRIGRWWPVADLSVFGAGSSVAFLDGQLLESSPDGGTSVWGTLTRWDPPDALAFTWHPGRGAEGASRVEVTFSAAGEQTLVTLIHTGWEGYDDPTAARDEYDSGWPAVLECFRAGVAAAPQPSAPQAQPEHDREGAREQSQEQRQEQEQEQEQEQDGETWVALLHRPGPAAPTEGSIFQDPRIGAHFAFLTRMRAAGYLIAAGPFDDELGAGMTILRLPGPDRLDEATRLATQDDTSVLTEFLTVTVRPWQVMLSS